MNRKDFQNLAALRVRDAKVLLDSGRFEGAYYLLGYAIECALKACIAKQTRRYTFPEKEFAHKVWTHNLNDLVKLAGLETERIHEGKTNPAFETNWAIVKDWTEKARYEHIVKSSKARDFYSAVVNRKSGVLTWLKKHW